MRRDPAPIPPPPSLQQKRGWTKRPRIGTGIHPPSPGALATAARVGTHGAPSSDLPADASTKRRVSIVHSTFDCPASLFGSLEHLVLRPDCSTAAERSPASIERAHKCRRAARRSPLRCADRVKPACKARSPLNLLRSDGVSTGLRLVFTWLRSQRPRRASISTERSTAFC